METSQPRRITVLNSELIVAVLTVIGLMMYAPTMVAQKRDSARRARLHTVQRAHDIYGIPNLSDDQKKRIDALRAPLAKETLPILNQLREKEAHLNTLQTAETTDLTAVNSTIDLISELRSQLMKKRAAHTEAIRKILNEEQRVAFDMRSAMPGWGSKMRRKG